MVGRRRVVLTVLVGGSVALATGSPSNGIETTTAGTGGAQQALALSGPTPSSPGTTDIASAADNAQVPKSGLTPRIAANGRWVVFGSIADLQPANPSAKAGQTNVFVRDVKTGATVQLSRAAAGDGTPRQPTSSSSQPAITDDGRFVTFLTAATNIVPTSGTAPLTLVLCDRDPDTD